MLPDSGAGFYGKITSHGDFVSRRLPDGFVSVWDHWLQTGLHGSRALLGECWLATYLSSPIWRFALAPGVCGEQAWAGVMMPSVDRVGRHFPLTIGAGIAGDVPLLDWIECSAGWYDALEVLALSTLAENADFAQFDVAVQAIGAPLVPATVPAAGHLCVPITGLDALPQALPGLARTLAHAALAGQGVWWTDGSADVAPSLHVWRGLPSGRDFSGMLDGDWGGG